MGRQTEGGLAEKVWKDMQKVVWQKRQKAEGGVAEGACGDSQNVVWQKEHKETGRRWCRISNMLR